MRNLLTHLSVFVLLMIGLGIAPKMGHAQNNGVLSAVRDAVKAGNSRELTRHFADMVELNIENKSGNYTREQATVLLNAFFDQHPCTDFTYIHQGASSDGTQYAIGRYAFEQGSYRVFMLVKKAGDGQRVKLLNIAED
jgi:hypothetical protein